ncbi:hypothetical protein GJ496_006435 [Pomphorhynchus laevis]|nr:hypothetical protein GJ496_006435 [Pomphorhynchus laevis]
MKFPTSGVLDIDPDADNSSDLRFEWKSSYIRQHILEANVFELDKVVKLASSLESAQIQSLQFTRNVSLPSLLNAIDKNSNSSDNNEITCINALS